MADRAVYKVKCAHCHRTTAIPNDTAEAIADDAQTAAVRERSAFWKALVLVRAAAKKARDCNVEAGEGIAARHDALITTVLRIVKGALSERERRVIDYASIIDCAVAAKTVDEECDVILDAVDMLRVGHSDLNGMRRLVIGVQRGDWPRACLLGAVACLVPDGMFPVMGDYQVRRLMGTAWADLMDENGNSCVSEADGPTLALALLIAICRALQEKEVASS